LVDDLILIRIILRATADMQSTS